MLALTAFQRVAPYKARMHNLFSTCSSSSSSVASLPDRPQGVPVALYPKQQADNRATFKWCLAFATMQPVALGLLTQCSVCCHCIWVHKASGRPDRYMANQCQNVCVCSEGVKAHFRRQGCIGLQAVNQPLQGLQFLRHSSQSGSNAVLHLDEQGP